MNVSKSLISTSLPGQMVRKTQKTFFEFSLITRGLPKWLSGKRICLPMQEMWICSLGRKDILEKKMATHSSILAWEIPWTEESMVGYPCSRGSQKVRHNLETKPKGFPGDSVGGESARSAGAPGSSPGPGGSSGEGNGNPLQYSCLENSTDRGAWWATVHGVTKSRTQLSN